MPVARREKSDDCDWQAWRVMRQVDCTTGSRQSYRRLIFSRVRVSGHAHVIFLSRVWCTAMYRCVPLTAQPSSALLAIQAIKHHDAPPPSRRPTTITCAT
eukprot:scaffold1255_cov40-Cyclotella_meneghiniana.AAC.1